MDSIFNMLSVITSRSSLVSAILKFRTAVVFYMADICVLRQLLFLIGHVDQDIESLTFAIPVENRLELLLVKLNELLNGLTESIQQAVVLFAPHAAGRAIFFWRIVDCHLPSYLASTYSACNLRTRSDLMGNLSIGDPVPTAVSARPVSS